MENQTVENNKNGLFNEISELRKLIFDIETEEINSFNASIILPILRKTLAEKQDEYFA